MHEENISDFSNLIEMCFWIRDNVEEESILFATNPARVSFFTQKKAFYFKVIDPAAFAMILERFSVKYILYNDNVFYDRNYLYPLLKFFDFEKVVNIDKCYLYRVK